MSATKNTYVRDINYIHPSMMAYVEAVNNQFIEYQYNNRERRYWHQDLLYCISVAKWNKKTICTMKKNGEFNLWAQREAVRVFNKILARIETVKLMCNRSQTREYSTQRADKIYQLIENLKNNLI